MSWWQQMLIRKATELPDWFVQEHGRAEVHLCAGSVGPACAQQVTACGQSGLPDVLVCRAGGAPTKLRQFCGLHAASQQGFVYAATFGRRPAGYGNTARAAPGSFAGLPCCRSAEHVGRSFEQTAGRRRIARVWASLDPRRSRTADWRRLLDAGQLRLPVVLCFASLRLRAARCLAASGYCGLPLLAAAAHWMSSPMESTSFINCCQKCSS